MSVVGEKNMRKDMHTTELIIVADDYGIREASLPILRLVEEGLVERVAVLVRFVSAEDVAALKATGVTVDIHLELTRLLGRGESEGDSFVARVGNFAWHVIRGDLAPSRIKAEWCAQIALFREQFGCLPAGMNSHEHVHFFPWFFAPFLALAEEYGIGYIRFGARGIVGDRRFHPAKAVLDFLHAWNRRLGPAVLAATSEYLVSADWIDDIDHFLRQAPVGRIEVVAHPERPDEAALLRALKKLGAKR